jgi:hypothetical protein
LRKAVGLGKEITGVDEHHRDAGHHPGHQVEHDGRLDAEAGGQDEPVAKFIRGPTDALLGGGCFEIRKNGGRAARDRCGKAGTHGSRPKVAGLSAM